MSAPSRWPLPKDGIRFVAPEFIEKFMLSHPLTRGCYPLAMGYYPTAANHKMKRAVHDNHLLIYCVDGCAQLTTEQGKYVVEAGNLLVLPRGVSHAYRADSDKPWTLYWCHFDGSVSDDFIGQIADTKTASIIPIGHCAPILAGFKAILAVRKTGYSNAVLIHSANQLRQLLANLPIELQAYNVVAEYGFNIDKIQSYMWQNISGQISLDMLADTAKLSKYHFSARYKKITGYSPIKHFIHMKMEHACFLLDSTDLNVAKVAQELGYDDSLYFSRLFKKTLGLSPKQYRLSH